MQEEQEGGDTTEQETPTMIVPTDAGPPKRSIIQIGGSHKKSKAHKDILNTQLPRMMQSW
jgi:hypothetical protein